jgi:hypothetical protein
MTQETGRSPEVDPEERIAVETALMSGIKRVQKLADDGTEMKSFTLSDDFRDLPKDAKSPKMKHPLQYL